ncbi:MAG: DEAD/DEAH box helicase [Propionibacteriaceae bacterium]|jgi:superfamily II DNA/RNA helicase|nr:DEAD/DEAH box helicase [Propionibacteriaceae bacterium]
MIDQTSTPEKKKTFATLGVEPAIVKALRGVGITEPFPIQELAIPIALSGKDMIGQARTGTGKTLAFGVAVLQNIKLPSPSKKPQALVLLPTRELASQVSDDLTVASTFKPTRVLTVYGGVGYEPQLNALEKGVDVVVGTPGRIIDLVDRGSLDLSEVSVLVLDEADEMLDMGFLPDVEKIVSKTPKSRQTLLFSATMPSAIVSLARSQLDQPINVRAETGDAKLTVPDTKQFVYRAHDLDKPALVGKLLQARDRGRVIIFTNTKRAAERLLDELKARGFAAKAIHGDISQVSRERALEKFREGKIDILVATDVAARGLDIDDVTHVVNYECPDDELTYVHRIGRTGRAGASGIAVTLVDWRDLTRWKVINRVLKLGFEEPAEIYSTSPEFLADLDIPEDAPGWLTEPDPDRPLGGKDRREERSGRGRGHRDDRKPSKGVERGRDRDRDRRPRRQNEDRPAEVKAEHKPRKERTRRRLHNGKPVE